MTINKNKINKDLVIGISVGVAITSIIGLMFTLTLLSRAVDTSDNEDSGVVAGATEKANAVKAPAKAAPVATVATKSSKPTVELFVMSHCPYGLQMEKGILPVVKKLGSKIDFSLKFNDYAMHGEKELNEQMNQYCIGEEQENKLIPYLECFTKSGDSSSCLTSEGINKNKLKTCVSKTDNEYDITSNFKAKIGYKGRYPGFDIHKADNQKYGVGGSPTLIINGAKIQSGRDSSSLLKTICSAFDNSPEECKSVLSSASPSSGFGAGTQAGGSAGGACN